MYKDVIAIGQSAHVIGKTHFILEALNSGIVLGHGHTSGMATAAANSSKELECVGEEDEGVAQQRYSTKHLKEIKMRSDPPIQTRVLAHPVPLQEVHHGRAVRGSGAD
eukprot:Filipodium_phascolosomae@DN4730_c0_g1_i1.p2